MIELLAVMSSVLKSATASLALGTPPFQFEEVPQLPLASPPAVKVHVAACATVLRRIQQAARKAGFIPRTTYSNIEVPQLSAGALK